MLNKYILAALLMTCVSSTVFAKVRFVPSMYTGGTGNIRDFGHVRIEGEISAQDIDPVRKALQKFKAQDPKWKWSQPLVFLHSSGGDVQAAIKIGKLLRSNSTHIVVDRNEECSSACIFILAGGVERIVLVGAKIGLHRPYFNKALFANLSRSESAAMYRSLIDMCRSYFDEMGIDGTVFEEMLKIPSHKVRYVDTHYAEKVGLHGSDPAYDEWLRARTENKIGKRKMRLRDAYVDCLNSGADFSSCEKRFGAGFN